MVVTTILFIILAIAVIGSFRIDNPEIETRGNHAGDFDPISIEKLIIERQNNPYESWDDCAIRLKFNFKFINRFHRAVSIDGSPVEIKIKTFNAGDMSYLLQVLVLKTAASSDVVEYDLLFDNPSDMSDSITEFLNYNFDYFPTVDEFCNALLNPLLSRVKYCKIYQ